MKNIKNILQDTIIILDTMKVSKEELLIMYDKTKADLSDFKDIHENDLMIINESNLKINKLVENENENINIINSYIYKMKQLE